MTDCGSPWYVAPEILTGRPYDASVDMWSIGVITYILLAGYPPFHHDNQTILFRKIKECEYRFDSPYWDSISIEAKDLIRKLLVLEPRRRLTVEQVLSHPSKGQLEGALRQLHEFLVERRGIIKKGSLSKKGHLRKNWKTRVFILTDLKLSYYDSEHTKVPKGEINLSDIIEVQHEDSTTKMVIRTARNKDYELQTKTSDEAVSWVEAISMYVLFFFFTKKSNLFFFYKNFVPNKKQKTKNKKYFFTIHGSSISFVGQFSKNIFTM
eukprot:GSMAST32.ASY1.ANO1.126.1 assembled CDS